MPMLLSRRNRPALILLAVLAMLIALLCTVCVPMRVYAAELSCARRGSFTLTVTVNRLPRDVRGLRSGRKRLVGRCEGRTQA